MHLLRSNEKKAKAKTTQGFSQMNSGGYQTIQIRKTVNKGPNLTADFYEKFCTAFRD